MNGKKKKSAEQDIYSVFLISEFISHFISLHFIFKFFFLIPVVLEFCLFITFYPAGFYNFAGILLSHFASPFPVPYVNIL